jgi:DNA ligase-associated metallophosphoesterase
MNRLKLAESVEPSIPQGEPCQVNGVALLCDHLGALYVPDLKLLVVSDLHLEKGAAFARRGRLLPPYDTAATLRILDAAIKRYDPLAVISLGDNFHDQPGSALMPEEYRQQIEAMARGRDWVWITGNHDPDGVSGLPGQEAESLSTGGLTFLHEPQRDHLPGEIAGHLHPAAKIRRREKTVRRPCFATDGKRLIMPSFGVMTGGLDLNHHAFDGLFEREQLVAYMIGRERIYPVRGCNLA